MLLCSEGSGKTLQDIRESGHPVKADVGPYEMEHGEYFRVKIAIDFEYIATYGLDKVCTS